MEKEKTKANLFLLKYKEAQNFNQYWYSPATIKFLVGQSSNAERCCYMSTPSVYFSIDNAQLRKRHCVFDFDEKFKAKNEGNYFKYDFNHPEAIPEQYHGAFDFLVIDPPFITKEVWSKYTEAVKKVAKKDQHGKIIAKILLSSIDENKEMLKQMLEVKQVAFRPSIPHLVYQYSFYANYEDPELDKVNPQIGF